MERKKATCFYRGTGRPELFVYRFRFTPAGLGLMDHNESLPSLGITLSIGHMNYINTLAVVCNIK